MDREQLLQHLDSTVATLRASATLIRSLEAERNALAKVASKEQVAKVLRDAGVVTTDQQAEAFIQKLSSMDPVEAIRSVLAPRNPLGETQAVPGASASGNGDSYFHREYEDLKNG